MLSLADLGAREDDPLSVWNALESANRDPKIRGLKILEGNWTIPAPFRFDNQKFTIEGESYTSSRLRTTNGGGYDPLIIGLKRHQIHNNCWIRDESGRCVGFRTCKNHHLSFVSTPLNFPATDVYGKLGWSGRPRLTFDICIKWYEKVPENGQQYIFSIGREGFETPFGLRYRDNSYFFNYKASDGKYRIYRIIVPELGDIHELTFCIDLVDGKGYASINGTNTLCVYGGEPQALNLGFKENLVNPLNIGYAGDTIYGEKVSVDFGILGFKISEGCTYAHDEPGTMLRRVDGMVVNAASRYKNDDEGLIGRLEFTENPYDPTLVRVISGTKQVGNWITYGYMLRSGYQGNGDHLIEKQRVRDLGIYVAGPWGNCLGLGGNAYAQVENVHTEGGRNGIACIPIGGSWPIHIRDVWMDHYYNAGLVLGNNAICYVNGVSCNWVGNAAVQCLGSGNYTIRDLMMNLQQTRGEHSLQFLCGEGPRNINLSNIGADNEGYAYPSDAYIYIENNYFGDTNIHLEDITPGHTNASKSSIIRFVGDPRKHRNVSKARISGNMIHGYGHDATLIGDSNLLMGTLNNITNRKVVGCPNVRIS